MAVNRDQNFKRSLLVTETTLVAAAPPPPRKAEDHLDFVEEETLILRKEKRRLLNIDLNALPEDNGDYDYVIRSSSKLSKIFLAAMVHELYKTGMGETTFEKLAMTVSCFCSNNGEPFPGYDTLLKVGCKLGGCRILLCEAGTRHKLQKLQLNYPSDDVTFALKESKDLPWLTKYL